MIVDGYSCLDEMNFGRDMHVFEDIYQRLQRRTSRIRNLSSRHKDVNVLWIYINRTDEDGTNIGNKVMIVDKTVVVEEKFVC